MNNIWKKGIAAATLGIAILAQTQGAHAQGLYKANDDDTFWKLSNEFGVTVNALIQANPFVDADNIYAGLQLVIPAAAQAASAKVEGPVAIQAAKALAEPAKEESAEAKQVKPAAKPAAKAPAKKSAAKQAAVKQTVVKKATAAKKTAVKQTTATRTAAKKATAKKATAKTQQNRIDVNGKSYAFKDVVQAKASAYTAAASENGWGPVDYFGNPLKLGTIAVDPDVIPMGSKVYITGYDYNGLPSGGMLAVATDQGGAINGNRIDIFVPQSRESASAFGFQNVKVFILN